MKPKEEKLRIYHKVVHKSQDRGQVVEPRYEYREMQCDPSYP